MADDVWLLAGNRRGELAQQRALGAALGLSTRELAVARMAPSGKAVTFDFSAIRPPWPRLAISFGKTLTAALLVRERSGGRTRLVHLGLPRKLRVDALDLILPMPTDRYIDAPNVLRLRMPLNPAPPMPAGDSPVAAFLSASCLPRPWIALIVGGHTSRARLEPRDVIELAQIADAHAQARGGSLLVSTSPRTPPEAIGLLRQAITAPHAMHAFDTDAAANPYASYVRSADELIVTGDSASMIAECWRSGHPLWVKPLRLSPRRRLMRALRAAVPHRFVASGLVAADIDIDAWVRRLARAGTIGLLGASDPIRPYCSDADDDMARAVARIRDVLGRRESQG